MEYLHIQCKLSVGAPDDPMEDEADSMADRIMRMPETPFVQRKCEECEKDMVQRKPLVSFIQRNISDNADELDDDTEVMRKPEANIIQRKCAPCEEKEKERIQRKPLASFIQRKSGDGAAVASDTVSKRIESGRGNGDMMQPSSRNFMESRFGADFSDVRVHNDEQSAQLSKELSAQAFTVGRDIYFNSGKYSPETNEGKHLLAHELTHVIQQNGDQKLQKKTGDIELSVTETSPDVDYDIGYLLSIYKNLHAPADLSQVLVLSGTTAKFYNIQTKEKGFDKIPIGTYHIKQLNLPPYYLVGLANDKFGIVGMQDIDMGGENSTISDVLIGGKRNTPQEKKIFAQVDKELSLPEWFISEKDRKHFFSKLTGAAGFAVIILPASRGAGKAAGGEKGAAKPPMPSWMGAYQAEMNKLIKETKLAEPKSTDLPDKFYAYYSMSKEAWRAAASQVIGVPAKTLEVYLDITQKDDKKEKLQEIRDKIRIRQLHNPADISKESKPLDPALEWAYRLKLELDVKLGEERKVHPDAAYLPDKTGITTKEDSPNTVYLKLWLYVATKDKEGKAANELKIGVMATPLVPHQDINQLFEAVKAATLALRGGEIKSIDENPQHYKNILIAFPASLEGLNVRDDYVSVTGAELEMFMNVNTAGVPGMDLLGETLTRYRGIMYTWDVYRVKEVIPPGELIKMSKNWKERRKELQGWFKNSGQLAKANPVLKEKYTWNSSSPIIGPEDLRTLRNKGITYGHETSYDSKGTIEMPQTEGEYVIYCRAISEPSEDTFRYPSESFFTVNLVDGYKLAAGVRDERTNAMARLEKDISEEKDEEKKKELQESLNELKKQETRTLGEGTKHSIDKQKELSSLASKLKNFYTTASSDRDVTDLMVLELKKKLITKEQFKIMLDLWTYVETSEPEKKPADKLAKIITDTDKSIKQMGEVLERIAMFDDDLKGYHIEPAPVVGLVSKVTGQVYPLLLTIGIGTEWGGRTHAMLVDVTTHETQGSYEGISDKGKDQGGYEEAVMAAFKKFGEKCAYGEGYIAYRVPGSKAQGQVESAPGTWEKVKHVLSIVAAVAGIAALIVGTIFTGGALAVVAAYVGVGAMIVGAALAVDNIYDRAVNHRLHADVELAMDILSIAGPVLQGAGSLARLSKVATLKSIVNAAEVAGDLSTGEKGVMTLAMISKLEKIVMLEKTLMIIQKGDALTNLGLIGYKTYKDLAMVAEVYADNPEKMAAMQAVIIKNAVISGTFAVIALRSEFKMRNADELDALTNNLMKTRDYESAMIRSGLKDSEGNWRDSRLKEFFLGKEKEIGELGSPKTEKDQQQAKTGKQTDEPPGKHEPDAYEKDRKVEMKGHEETPDKQHDVEVYKNRPGDEAIGRCSSTPGAQCPALALQFKKTIEERPILKKEYETLRDEIKKYNENVPVKKLKELAAMEQRMRTLETVSIVSMSPKNYKIKEVAYDFREGVPLTAEKTVLEYPGGERIWRDQHGIHHEGDIKKSIGRQGYERDFYSASESGIPTFAGTERAHSFGQGFGWESPFALYNAPRFVNQRLQNNGIEQYVRSIRDLLPAGQKLVLHTTTKAVPDTRRLQSITYEGFVLTAAGEKIPAFKYEINVAWKAKRGSVVDAAPIEFVNNSNPAHQKVVNDLKGLIPKTKMPEPITQKIHQDIQ